MSEKSNHEKAYAKFQGDNRKAVQNILPHFGSNELVVGEKGLSINYKGFKGEVFPYNDEGVTRIAAIYGRMDIVHHIGAD